MAEAGDTTSHDEAQAMLDIFASVGADRFDVTRTTAAGDKDWFRRGVSLADLARTLPAMLDAATAEQRNVIVRPHGPGVSFLQLDDLAADQLPALRPAVFLTLETSPGNFQAWLALPGREDKDFARRVRKGTGADATASGATRVAGSLNFKDKYAPNFPRVTIREARAGHLTSAAELERLGLVAPPEEFAAVARDPCPLCPWRQSPMAELCPRARRRTARQRGPRPRPQPGGFRMVHDRDHMGLRRRRDRRAADRGKHKGPRQRQRLRRADRAQCRASRRASATATAADRRNTGGARPHRLC